MKPAYALPIVMAAIGIAMILSWLRIDSGKNIEKRVPGTDITAEQAAALGSSGGRFQGILTTGSGVPADIPGEWPRFRGADSDNISKDPTKLARSWDTGGPKKLWSISVGEGYAGAAIWNGRVYLLDYDAEKKADALRCLSLADGKEIWRFSYPVKIKRNHGMSRTIPAVNEKYVVSIGPKNHVVCLDSVTGEMKWHIDLVREYNSKVPLWYSGQCPLIEDGKAIIAPGGDALMIAVDCETGEVIWRTPNPRGWQMTHASIIPTVVSGRRMYVYPASGGVVGVAADNGSLLWETEEWRISIATVPSPLPLGDGRIFLSGGYNAGSMMIQIVGDGENFTVEPLFRLKPDVFGATQQTPIYYNGYIYGVRPDGQLVCLDPEGNPIWESGAANQFGIGPFMIADGMIFAMDDDGKLTIAEAHPDAYTELAEAKILDGHESWGPMAIAAGRLIARDLTTMACFDVR